MTDIKKIHPKLRGLWELQYQPLEKLLYKICKEKNNKDIITKYENCKISKKMFILEKAGNKAGLI